MAASTPGCLRLSARSVVQCGMPNFRATSSVPDGFPPASDTTSTPSIFAIASRCLMPNAPCPATQIFMVYPQLSSIQMHPIPSRYDTLEHATASTLRHLVSQVPAMFLEKGQVVAPPESPRIHDQWF